jgi:Glycosyl transferases group 1
LNFAKIHAATQKPMSARPKGNKPLRVAVIGVSESRNCGVYDHATLLGRALAGENISCSLHWLRRSESSVTGARSEFRAWTQELATELHGQQDAILLHYSVFSYSYRGLPLFVRPTLAALRATGLPTVTVMHEPAYPWRIGGLRGKVWAATQRAALVGVMRSSAAVVVTAPFRADWLSSRRWLARRPIALAPVYSNLPPPACGAPRAHRQGPAIGLFGYAYEGAASALVLDALALMHARGLPARLSLLGAPGGDSPAGRAWLAAARRRGLERSLSFSGVLPAEQLSGALAACDVLLHVEPTGPTSRKGTLAASLAAGRAVVALDGPLRWQELLDAQALAVVQPTPVALADATQGLLEDDHARKALGARGRAFAASAMSVERSARVVAELLERTAAPAGAQAGA